MRKRKTKCKRGHRFTIKNTYIDKHGARNCLKCRRIHSIARSKNPGIGTGGVNKAKTHCSFGHPLIEGNFWLRTRRGLKTRVCKFCMARRTKENRRRKKQQVIDAYGGKCAVSNCGITDPDMLTVDHVNDDGAKERVRGVSSGDAIYRRIIKQKFPKRYQILCANHNLKKEIQRLRANS